MQLRGSRILLTGASGGLGAAIARRLASEGADVVLSARRESVLASLAEEIGAQVLVADLADRGDQERVCDEAMSCDGIVANAGLGIEPDITGDPAEVIRTTDLVIEVNLRAPIVLAQRYAAARMERGEPGAIVLMGSLAGVSATPGTHMYNATKFGLRGFSLSFAQELRGTDVTCSVVAPGFIAEAGMHHDSGMQLPRAVRKKVPADVADAVVVALTKAPPEVFVAPPEMRAGSLLSAVAPRLSAAVLSRIGASEMTGGGMSGQSG